MLAFRSGKRSGTVMNRIAKGYSDEDIELLAGYLATQGSSN
jgi:sulfide dehydrogenase cytochrome subunit